MPELKIPAKGQTRTVTFAVHELTDQNRTSDKEYEPTCQWCQAETAGLVYVLDGHTILEICVECHELQENPQ